MTEKLEEFLRELIKRGREPRGKKYSHLNCDPKRKHRHIMLVGDDIPVFSYSLRQLVGLESGLWQFVCENRLQKDNYSIWGKTAGTTNIPYDPDYTEYRLIESSLIPEEELGKFLVDNIIITCNSK